MGPKSSLETEWGTYPDTLEGLTAYFQERVISKSYRGKVIDDLSLEVVHCHLCATLFSAKEEVLKVHGAPYHQFPDGSEDRETFIWGDGEPRDGADYCEIGGWRMVGVCLHRFVSTLESKLKMLLGPPSGPNSEGLQPAKLEEATPPVLGPIHRTKLRVAE